jgi:omega-hydroxy-beta-dihydromenaquinone-9 sulfotransferase
VRAVFERMLTPKRNRLLVKLTGWSRIGFLNEIFEDAKFIHIVRDGRAVASSLLHVHFWRGWYGPQGWRAGLLSPEDQASWESYDRSFTALAGLEWRIQMRAIEAARRALDPTRFLEVKYETFCEQPLETFRRVLRFAELPDSADFERHVSAAPIRSTSNRWRNDLSAGQQDLLDDLLREDLVQYGYDPSGTVEKFRETVER